MPITKIYVYRDARGEVPIIEWLDDLERRFPKAYKQCAARIIELRRSGHEMRRPMSDYLRDGIRELRAHHGRVQYRILYSFVGKDVAILSHGITKKSAVPNQEIEIAIRCLADVRADFEKHTLPFPEDDDENDA